MINARFAKQTGGKYYNYEQSTKWVKTKPNSRIQTLNGSGGNQPPQPKPKPWHSPKQLSSSNDGLFPLPGPYTREDYNSEVMASSTTTESFNLNKPRNSSGVPILKETGVRPSFDRKDYEAQAQEHSRVRSSLTNLIEEVKTGRAQPKSDTPTPPQSKVSVVQGGPPTTERPRSPLPERKRGRSPGPKAAAPVPTAPKTTRPFTRSPSHSPEPRETYEVEEEVLGPVEGEDDDQMDVSVPSLPLTDATAVAAEVPAAPRASMLPPASFEPTALANLESSLRDLASAAAASSSRQHQQHPAITPTAPATTTVTVPVKTAPPKPPVDTSSPPTEGVTNLAPEDIMDFSGVETAAAAPAPTPAPVIKFNLKAASPTRPVESSPPPPRHYGKTVPKNHPSHQHPDDEEVEMTADEMSDAYETIGRFVMQDTIKFMKRGNYRPLLSDETLANLLSASNYVIESPVFNLKLNWYISEQGRDKKARDTLNAINPLHLIDHMNKHILSGAEAVISQIPTILLLIEAALPADWLKLDGQQIEALVTHLAPESILANYVSIVFKENSIEEKAIKDIKAKAEIAKPTAPVATPSAKANPMSRVMALKKQLHLESPKAKKLAADLANLRPAVTNEQTAKVLRYTTTLPIGFLS